MQKKNTKTNRIKLSLHSGKTAAAAAATIQMNNNEKSSSFFLLSIIDFVLKSTWKETKQTRKKSQTKMQ